MADAIIFNQRKNINGKYYYLARFGWCFHNEGYVVPESWIEQQSITFKGKRPVSVSF
ncbi:hypothetical protein J4219_08185 [Candidatus Woesearchaeota archaeon]|nr:hypothetical protein [Candidatus Woesearchaeota archaeon]